MKFISTLTFAFLIILVSQNYNSFGATHFGNPFFQVAVFRDTSDVMGAQSVKILMENNSKLFIPSDSIHQPFSIKSTYWLYLQSINIDSLQEYVLAFHIFLSRIEVYPYPFTMISSYGGVAVPGRLKALSGSNVSLKPGVSSYLIKVQNRIWSTGSVKNVEITSSHAFQKRKEKQDLLQAFMQGFFWLMLLYNLSLYILIRKKIHLYYVIYVFLNSLFFFFISGYSEIYIFPNNYRLNLIFWTFQLVGSFFYLMFLRMALIGHCSAYTPFIDRKVFLPYAYIRLVINVTASCTVFYRMDIFTRLSGLCNLLGTVVGIGICICFYKRADRFLRIIMTGSMILILFGWVSLLYVRFYLHSNNLFFETGMLIELLLFTYALNMQRHQDIEELYKAELMKHQLEDELENKNRELVYQAMQLSAKEEAISSIREKIKEIKDSGKINELILAETELNNSVNRNLWKEFEIHFSETHPNFYKALLDKYPALTQNELRLCAFLKLNLNTKEIAMITQKSAKSIEVMRSRIRQKMDVQRDSNLIHVLSRL
jgi:DNA-binding CsgD family transcriptional regulator